MRIPLRREATWQHRRQDPSPAHMRILLPVLRYRKQARCRPPPQEAHQPLNRHHPRARPAHLPRHPPRRHPLRHRRPYRRALVRVRAAASSAQPAALPCLPPQSRRPALALRLAPRRLPRSVQARPRLRRP
ncbi:hypothetical protein PENSPDRAFT_20088 [Peniophora sp. CONT]|nr:hypothetical protein PENSPDRAFT_20088 [Peniophora sp. CONT]